MRKLLRLGTPDSGRPHKNRSISLRSRRLFVELLEDRRLLTGDTYLINFQLNGALTPTRYASDVGEPFGLHSNGLTYGWSSDHSDVARDRNAQPDQRLDTLIHFHQGEAWDFQLPNGLYEVTVSIGDPSFGSVHTLNVEDVNYWNAVSLASGSFLTQTQQIAVRDGRLTLDQGAAGELATRINYVHIVGLPNGPNNGPAAPTITEPTFAGEEVNPADVHMEAINFSDPDGDNHLSTDWEIWKLGSTPERVWQTLGITGVERLHTHLGDGIFENSHAGLTQLISDSVPNFDFNTYTINLSGVTAGDNITVSAEMIDAVGGIGPSLSGMVDSFSLISPTSQELIQDGSFELATGGTQTSNSSWVMTTESDGVEPSAQFQTATWAASTGSNGVWFKGFRGTPSSPVDASVSQVVTAPTSGDYVLTFDAKVEEHFSEFIDAFRVTISSDGTGGSQTSDLLNSFAPEYELRVRFRDDAGSVSDYATLPFVVGAASTVFPLELEDVAASPTPAWLYTAGSSVILPAASPNQSSLQLQGAAGELLLSISGFNGTSNDVVNPASLTDHVNLRIVITAGSDGLTSGETELQFSDDHAQPRTLYLPDINLAANQRQDLWVASDGSTYFGSAAQTEPDFSFLARRADLPIPYVAFDPGFVIEEVAGGFQLPVNLAFVPNPGSNPNDPLFYVNELYGTIKVVTNDLTVSDYATNLLNFNPTGSFPGSGEQGLAGLVVDPVTGDLFVTRVADTDGLPGGVHHPQVVRLSSTDGGYTASSITVILDMIGETQGQSHQVSNATIGPDGKLYIHNGDGFDSSTALNLDSYRGKILRMNLDGTAPTDNPLYNAADGINSRDYIYAYGFRNPFGGAWRASDGHHYEVENGNALDRLVRVEEGGNYGWNGSDSSLLPDALYVWNPAHAPVNVEFVQPETFGGSNYPDSKQDHAFVSESGPTYALGPQVEGKRILDFKLDANGNVEGTPTTLIEYVGTGRGTVAGLAAGPDGLYFTELYKDLDVVTPIDAGARVFRVRFIGAGDADFDLDGDVDGLDFLAWQRGAGKQNVSKSQGDADNDDDVDGLDLAIWENEYGGGVLSSNTVSTTSTAALSGNGILAPPTTESNDVQTIDQVALEQFEIDWTQNIHFSLHLPTVFRKTLSETLPPKETAVQEQYVETLLTPMPATPDHREVFSLPPAEGREPDITGEVFAQWNELDLLMSAMFHDATCYPAPEFQPGARRS